MQIIVVIDFLFELLLGLPQLSFVLLFFLLHLFPCVSGALLQLFFFVLELGQLVFQLRAISSGLLEALLLVVQVALETSYRGVFFLAHFVQFHLFCFQHNVFALGFFQPAHGLFVVPVAFGQLFRQDSFVVGEVGTDDGHVQHTGVIAFLVGEQDLPLVVVKRLRFVQDVLDALAVVLDVGVFHVHLLLQVLLAVHLPQHLSRHQAQLSFELVLRFFVSLQTCLQILEHFACLRQVVHFFR